jgi:CDGSH-type Zn-finger protein
MNDSASLPIVTITPRDHGGYRVTGPVMLQDAEGASWAVPEGKAVFLCRCGLSANKPFCDSSHRDGGFESVVRAPAPEA